MSKRLFISHSWSYSERYNSMVDLLDNRRFFNWINYSVPESKAFIGLNSRGLSEKLQDQIRPVQCVIIIGGMWTSYSDWIQYEMNFAKEIGKPILGVRPRSAKLMPRAVTESADLIVNWNSNSIVDGIRQIS